MGALWLNVLVGGALMGLVYGLIACGLTLVFGVMRLVNFAHGEMVVMGMYAGYWLSVLAGIPTLAAVPIAAAGMFAFGYALQRLVLQRFTSRPQHVQFILFVGIALVITALHLMMFGPDARAVTSPLSFETLDLGPLSLDLVRVQAAAGAALLAALLVLFIALSPIGRAVRAAADNPLGGLVVGINIPRVYAVTAGIGAACAGAAGTLVSPMFDTQPFLAVDFTLIAFVTVIVGGLGSLPGALVGGVLIGVAEAAAALAVDPALKSAFSYALLVVILLIRPAGLFGTHEA